jgi:heme-degrading monooxygenase HmoA
MYAVVLLNREQFSKKEQAMYLVIRRLKVKPHLLDEAIQRFESGYVPIISNEPGFVAFYEVQVGEDEGLSISIFETQESAEDANKRALMWARENLAPLAQGPAEIVAVGEVRGYMVRPGE